MAEGDVRNEGLYAWGRRLPIKPVSIAGISTLTVVADLTCCHMVGGQRTNHRARLSSAAKSTATEPLSARLSSPTNAVFTHVHWRAAPPSSSPSRKATPAPGGGDLEHGEQWGMLQSRHRLRLQPQPAERVRGRRLFMQLQRDGTLRIGVEAVCPEGQSAPHGVAAALESGTTLAAVLSVRTQSASLVRSKEGPASGVDSCVRGSMCWSVDTDTNMGVCTELCVGSENAQFLQRPHDDLRRRLPGLDQRLPSHLRPTESELSRWRGLLWHNARPAPRLHPARHTADRFAGAPHSGVVSARVNRSCPGTRRELRRRRALLRRVVRSQLGR